MKATIVTSSVQTANTCNPIHEAVAVPPTLIKKKELATRLSVSPRTIDEWVRKRKIPYLQIRDRFYLYEFEAVLAALRKLYQVDARS
jgi:excisionase family DNA binding protein